MHIHGEKVGIIEVYCIFVLFKTLAMECSLKVILIVVLLDVTISTPSQWDGILPWYSGSSKYLDGCYY